MSKIAPKQQTYTAPQMLSLGNAAELTRGMGDLYTDSLGNTSTHYGKADQRQRKN